MRQVPGREPDGFTPPAFFVLVFFVLVFVPQFLYCPAPDVPGP